MAPRPDNFTCAAMLMAYAGAARDGDIAYDEELVPTSLMSVMYHLNAWAMPQDIREPDAFAQVQEEADRMRAVMSEEELVDYARWCVENKPS